MKYVLGVLGVILLAVVAVVLIVSMNPSSNNGQKSGGKPAVNLLDYISKDSSHVSWTQQGPVVGEDERRAVRVTVSASERKIEILDGYEETVERSQTYPNSPDAYNTFLRSLKEAGFSKERTVSQPDEKAVCPLGNRFIYDLTDGSNQIVRTWSASCSTTLGPFAGNSNLTRSLFQNQIPDYSTQIKNVKLFK